MLRDLAALDPEHWAVTDAMALIDALQARHRPTTPTRPADIWTSLSTVGVRRRWHCWVPMPGTS